MKEFAIQKQLISSERDYSDPDWERKQVWVPQLDSDNQPEEFENLSDAQGRLMTLSKLDPTNRVYRIVQLPIK